jgi:predicted RNase H-like HicB family nuclease
VNEPGTAKYHVAIHRYAGSYLACVANLPGCVGRGASQVEAVENARAAIRAWLSLGRMLSREDAVTELEITA